MIYLEVINTPYIPIMYLKFDNIYLNCLKSLFN